MRGLVLLAASLAMVQPPQRPVVHTPATTDTQTMSGSAVATLVTEDWAAIDLLVLWRGKPGWFMTSDYQASRGGSGPLFNGTLYASGHFFNWDINFRTRIAHVAGRRLDLKDHNVVLVDGIGTAAGPRVVRTLKIDGVPSAHGPQIGPLVWRVPELSAYLQCDQRFSDARVQVLHALACTPVTGPSPETAVRAVNLMLSRFAQLSRGTDVTAVASMYTRDGEIVNPRHDVVKGRAAIEASLRRVAGDAILEYELKPVATAGDKNGVVQKGTFRQRVRTPQGQVVETSGTFTAEWEIEDFVWHIKRMTRVAS
jgi:ketosteroid isomerase-like protein